MGNYIDLKGSRFGRLLVVEAIGKYKNGSTKWRCLCDCGNEACVSTGNLNSGSTMSCGCLRREITTSKNYKHGLSNKRIHSIWRGMKQRCENPKNISFQYYGLRGISICDEWSDDFKKFYDWSMNNGYSDNMSIDRINVYGNYEPCNCRWVNIDVQNNNRGNNHYLSIDGKTLTISQWSKISGVNRKTITDRIIRFGWDPKETVFTEAH